jgi:hypothetical protein
MPTRTTPRKDLDWERILIAGGLGSPRTPALFGDGIDEAWRAMLKELCGTGRVSELLACDERRLREVLLEGLPAQGVPPAQVLGMTEELQVAADDATRFGIAAAGDRDRFQRIAVALETDARRASGVATAIGRVTRARVVNWCNTYPKRPGDDDRLERCEAFRVTALEGGTLRLESAAGIVLTVPVGRWAVGRSRAGDRYYLETGAGTAGPRLVRLAAAAPVAATKPEQDPAERDDLLGPDQAVRLHISLSSAPGVTRDVELLGSHTLDDLHAAIRDAFEWEGDHPYLFRLAKDRHDPSADHLCEEFGATPRSTDAPLASVTLYPRRKFWYVWDLGKYILHDVEVAWIGPRPPRARFPRFVARHGKLPDRRRW